jgi:hypothetical protein
VQELNFRVLVGENINSILFDEVIYDTPKIESSYKEITIKNSIQGTLILLGFFKLIDKFDSLDNISNGTDHTSLQDISVKLEGFFLVNNNKLSACSGKFVKIDIYFQQNGK